MHDCGVATGDRFLARLVPVLVRALGRDGYLVLTWDEGKLGPRLLRRIQGRPHRHHRRRSAGPAWSTRGEPLDHYGVLRTVEDSLGLPRLGAARDARHGDLTALFTRAPRIR